MAFILDNKPSPARSKMTIKAIFRRSPEILNISTSMILSTYGPKTTPSNNMPSNPGSLSLLKNRLSNSPKMMINARLNAM